MKLIEDYTKEELVELKTEEIEKIINLHLANDGIAIPRQPVEPQYSEIPEKDRKVYSITGVDSVYFSTREIADEVAKILRQNFSKLHSLTSDYFMGSSQQRVTGFLFNRYSREIPSASDITVNEIVVYSDELYIQIKSKLEANDKLREDYDKKKEAYDKSVDAARATIDMVWEKVRNAQREQEEKDSKLSTYREYLSLADGDKDVAWKFMKKAHSVTQDQEDYINANI